MFRLLACLLLLLTTGCASEYATASWQYVQQQRVDVAVPPLEWDRALVAPTQIRAQEIAALGALDHSGAQSAFNAFYGDRPYICEIIGRQPTWTAEYAIGYGWSVSPHHRDCALGANYRRAAIGAAMGADGWVYEVMWLTD